MKTRKTKQKALIREAMQGIGVHHSAEEVLDIVRQEDPEIGLATVYRNLNELCRQGELQKLSTEGAVLYDGNPAPHDHLHCLRCGCVTDAVNDYDSRLDEAVARRSHARVLRHSIIFEGICENCLKKEENTTWN